MFRKILVTAICLLPLLAGCEEEKVAEVIRPIKVMKVTRAAQVETRMFPGKVEATSEVALAFRVSGQLVDYPVSMGKFVKQGDLIAALDTTDYKIQVRGLEAQLFGAKAAMKEARLRYTRYKKLVADDHAAKASFDQAEAAYKTASAKVDSLTEQLNKATTDLDYATLEAPFSGYISTKYMDNYQTIRAGEPVVKLQDIDTLEVTVGLPDNLVIRQKDLRNITVELEAFPGNHIKAVVKEIAFDAEPQTRTYPLTVQFPRPENINFFPGMAANVTLYFAENANVAKMVLPETAVIADEKGKAFVWVFDSATSSVARREVVTARVLSDGIEVMSGLTAGDTVVTAGAHYLYDGQQVRLLDASGR